MKFHASSVLLVVALVSFPVHAQSAVNALINGGFEEPVVVGTVPGAPGADRLNGNELTGWTLYSGIVLFNTDYQPLTEGSQAVQIEYPGDWISQSFATVIGQSYTLSFDLSAYTGYGGPGLEYHPCPCASILEVTVGPISATVAGSSAGYVGHTLSFTAGSSVTTLKFQNPAVPAAFGNYPQIDNVVVSAVLPPPFLTVAIDIKPGSFPNSINLKSKGVIPVAILSNPSFNVVDVDVNTVSFAGASPEKFAYEDVNADGIADLILHFRTQDLQLSATSTQATLTGKLRGGLPITGTDSVRIVPAGPKSKQ